MFFIQFIINAFSALNHDGFNANDSFSENSEDAGHDPSDFRKLRWLSMQTITGFLMMFGWTAITCESEYGLQKITTFGISIAIGLFTGLIIRGILYLAKKLHSTGTTFNIKDAVGKEAYVYKSILKGNVGKISISLQNLSHEIDAISANDEELPSFIRVKIIKTENDNTVVVAPL